MAVLTIPPAGNRAECSFHWLHAERSGAPSIAQWYRGGWLEFGKPGVISPEELARRGWEYLGPVIGRPFSSYLDR